MIEDHSFKPDAIYTEPPKRNIFGKTPFDSGRKIYPSDNFLDKFFNKIRNTGIARTSPGILAGVCALIAQRSGVSVSIVRFFMTLLTIVLAGAPIFIYALAWLVLPDEQGTIHAQEFKHENISFGFGAATIMLVFGAMSMFLGKFVTLITWIVLLVIGFFALRILVKKEGSSPLK